jgi:hypothetical protein
MDKTDTSLVFSVSGYNPARHFGARSAVDPSRYQYRVVIEGDSWANILYPWSKSLGYNEAFSNFIDQDPRFYYNNVGWPGDTL